MKINEDQIQEYVKNGGRLFRIESIQSVRDGKTIQITCRNGDSFSIDKNTNKLYCGCPIDDKYEIKDILLRNYLLERIQVYSNRLKEDSIRIENIVNNLSKTY